MESYFIGVDVGTQGIRVALVNRKGMVLGSFSEKFELTVSSREEQSSVHWWELCEKLLSNLVSEVSSKIDLSRILSISVSSTSGTVVPLDENNNPLYNALMYSDTRSVEQGFRCREIAEKYVPNGFTGFNSSCALPKIVWFLETYPQKAGRIKKWIHASDFITGRLSGNFLVTDYTNALKTGYDLDKKCWPEYLFERLDVKREWMQKVVPTGTPIGYVCPEIACKTGLPTTVQVVVGLTDGCASQVASGAIRPGDWNTTIGTTLVIKGVTKNRVNDPMGRLYSHRHPDGYWMPGGASNTGADWITKDFGNDLERLNDRASTLIPTGKYCWPLKQSGERFPFICSTAEGFYPDDSSPEICFASGMEGVAYIERMAYELIEELSGEKVNAVYTAGGASNSDVWLKIRSSVLNVPIHKTKEANGAVGAAIAAASRVFFESIDDAVQSMTAIEKTVFPQQDLVEAYRYSYLGFRNELKKKNYIKC